jgi:hypothetical protein
MTKFWIMSLTALSLLIGNVSLAVADPGTVVAQSGPPTQVPAECERLTDPIQRAKCVEEKSKGKK